MSIMRHLNIIFDLWIFALTAAMAAQSMQGIFEQVENINISSDILNIGYSQSCSSAFEAAIVCLKADVQHCKATIYDSGSSSCHSFGVPLRGLFSASETQTGLTYLEKQCVGNGAQVAQLGSSGNCMQQEENNGTLDCQAYYDEGFRSDGVYTLYAGDLTFNAWCGFDDGNGWTYIQWRQDGSQTFDLPWNDYKLGFGDLYTEFWLGNDYIHMLTQTNQKLHIKMVVDNGTELTAEYSTFHVADEHDGYQLTVDGFQGSFGDSLVVNKNKLFTTYDEDNDDFPSQNCAAMVKGGWWYNRCTDASLNGLYGEGKSIQGIYWVEWNGNFDLVYNTTVMKITRN